MRGLAINITYVIVLMLFFLLVMFLLTGVWKELLVSYGGQIGLVKESQIIAGKESTANIYCSPQGSSMNYEVSIEGLKVYFDNPQDALAVLFFKGKAKLSENGVITKETISSENLPTLKYIIASSMEPTGAKESLLINFFSPSEKCISLGKASTSAEDFISNCAGNFIGTAQIMGPDVKCESYECRDNKYIITKKGSIDQISFDPSVSICCAYNKDAAGKYRSLDICPKGDTCNPDTGCSTKQPPPSGCESKPTTINGKTITICKDRYGEHVPYCISCKDPCRFRCFNDICSCDASYTCTGNSACTGEATCGATISQPGQSCTVQYPLYACSGSKVYEWTEIKKGVDMKADCGVGKCCVFNDYKSYSCCSGTQACDSSGGCV